MTAPSSKKARMYSLWLSLDRTRVVLGAVICSSPTLLSPAVDTNVADSVVAGRSFSVAIAPSLRLDLLSYG